MNDSRLFLEIGIEDNNTFVAIDRSPYERWSEDEHLSTDPHYVFQALYTTEHEDIDDRAIASGITLINENFENIRTWTVEDLSDGLYYYHRFILPNEDHNNNSNEALWYDDVNEKIMFRDKDSEDTRIINDWFEAYTIIVTKKPSNCFHFDDYSFSIFALIECYVNIQHDLLMSILKNGCAKDCKVNSELEFKADLLLAAINVLKDLMEKGDFFEAQRILSSLNTCGELCKNYNKKLNPCGCGDS